MAVFSNHVTHCLCRLQNAYSRYGACGIFAKTFHSSGTVCYTVMGFCMIEVVSYQGINML